MYIIYELEIYLHTLARNSIPKL